MNISDVIAQLGNGAPEAPGGSSHDHDLPVYSSPEHYSWHKALTTPEEMVHATRIEQLFTIHAKAVLRMKQLRADLELAEAEVAVAKAEGHARLVTLQNAAHEIIFKEKFGAPATNACTVAALRQFGGSWFLVAERFHADETPPATLVATPKRGGLGLYL